LDHVIHFGQTSGQVQVQESFATPGAGEVLHFHSSLVPLLTGQVTQCVDGEECLREGLVAAAAEKSTVVFLMKAEFAESVPFLSNLAASSASLLIVLLGDELDALVKIQQDSRGMAFFLKLPFWEVYDDASLEQAQTETYSLWLNLPHPVVWVVDFWQLSEPLSERGAVVTDATSPGKLPRSYHFSRLVQWEMRQLEHRFAAIYTLWSGNFFWGQGGVGMLFCGGCQRLAQNVREKDLKNFRVMCLTNQYPLPEGSLMPFLSGLEIVLVIEGHAPVVEQQLYVLIAKSGISLRIRRLPANIVGRQEKEREFLHLFLANPSALPSAQPLDDLGAFIGLK